MEVWPGDLKWISLVPPTLPETAAVEVTLFSGSLQWLGGNQENRATIPGRVCNRVGR